MRKHALIIVLAFIAPICSCADGWSTNLWPSWDYHRKGKQQSQQCYTALCERATGLGVSNPTAPTWYRAQRANLQQYKTWLKTHGTNFVDHHRAVNGNYSNWFATGAADFPMHSIESMASNACVPTNVLDYTPWRCHNGLGPFTNDTSVGHAYGWTNEYTVAGGDNFPAGRDTWYTTDYVLPAVTSMIGQCLWTRHAASGAGVLKRETQSSISTSDLAALYQNITNEWANKTTSRTPAGAGWYRVESYVTEYAQYDWWESRWMPSNYFELASIGTDDWHTAQFYMRFDDKYNPPGQTNFIVADPDELIEGLAHTGGATNRTLPDNYWHWIEGQAESQVATRSSTKLATLDADWTQDPAIDFWPNGMPTNHVKIGWGAEADEVYWLLKWDGTNGFDYR